MCVSHGLLGSGKRRQRWAVGQCRTRPGRRGLCPRPARGQAFGNHLLARALGPLPWLPASPRMRVWRRCPQRVQGSDFQTRTLSSGGAVCPWSVASAVMESGIREGAGGGGHRIVRSGWSCEASLRTAALTMRNCGTMVCVVCRMRGNGLREITDVTTMQRLEMALAGQIICNCHDCVLTVGTPGLADVVP